MRQLARPLIAARVTGANRNPIQPDAMAGNNDLFDRALLTRRRDRAAPAIEAHEFLLARVAEDMRDRLEAILRDFEICLDLGAHHGLVGKAIETLPSLKHLIKADLSLPMARRCGGMALVADEDFLPFADGSLDLVVSGLSLHWANDLPGALIQIARALKPDGLLMAAVLGGRTLEELRAALMQAESEITGGAAPRVAPFADVRDYGALMQRAGLALPVTDADLVRVTYESPQALMNEIRAMGAANALLARSRRPLSRKVLRRADEIYRERFSRDGRIFASFEIIMLTGWRPHESQQKPLKPGTARSRLADALGAEERPAGDKANPRKR